MNGTMGTRALDNGGTEPVATFLRRGDFIKAGRGELLVFADVHEDFIDTCLFSLDRSRSFELWANLPASRHDRRGVISYADGHVEIHKWQDSLTVQPVLGQYQYSVKATGSPDWRYVWERLTKATAFWGDP
jgi:prepilin-type processing-associated H-X9-DG protein